MKQQIVMKVYMKCDKCRSKALKIAAAEEGVNSVAIKGSDKNEVVVMGDGVDAVRLTECMRKKVGAATLVSVQEDKPNEQPGKEQDKGSDKGNKNGDKKTTTLQSVANQASPAPVLVQALPPPPPGYYQCYYHPGYPPPYPACCEHPNSSADDNCSVM